MRTKLTVRFPMSASTRQLSRIFAAAVLAVVLTIGLALPALAAETIRLFDSDVTLHTDGSVDVVEINPILDAQNRTAKIGVELVASLLGQTIY